MERNLCLTCRDEEVRRAKEAQRRMLEARQAAAAGSHHGGPYGGMAPSYLAPVPPFSI